MKEYTLEKTPIDSNNPTDSTNLQPKEVIDFIENIHEDGEYMQSTFMEKILHAPISTGIKFTQF